MPVIDAPVGSIAKWYHLRGVSKMIRHRIPTGLACITGFRYHAWELLPPDIGERFRKLACAPVFAALAIEVANRLKDRPYRTAGASRIGRVIRIRHACDPSQSSSVSRMSRTRATQQSTDSIAEASGARRME